MDDETQPFDSHLSPLHSGDKFNDKDFDHRLQNTLPFLETESCEDGLETQVVDFEGETRVPFEDVQETQVMNFDGETQVPFEDELETQVMNFAGETQVLDDFDNMDTKLLDEWNSKEADMTDGEESDRTELLCDTDELSDTDSVKVAACCAEDWEKTIILKQDNMENKEEVDALLFKKASGGVKINFTSIGAISLRASGLAARSKALSKSNGEICSSKSMSESLKETHGYAYEDKYATNTRESILRTLKIGVLEDEQRKCIKDESKAMNGTSAARRLFTNNDKLDENEGDNEIAGLSYVDSQEPGDLSQANALDFVDNFLKSSDTDFVKDVGSVRPIVKKSKPESGSKGIQSLAKKSRFKSIVDETGIYDWDDNREDEGGGEFFSRQKKVLYKDVENGSSLSRPASKARSTKKTAKKAKIEELRKNLTKELDEQLIVASANGTKTCSEKDLQATYNPGPDTQMAAEAMEVLCLGLDLTDKHTDLITKTNRKSSSTARNKDKSMPEKCSFGKRLSLSSNEDLVSNIKRRKKSGKIISNGMPVSSSKQNRSVREQHKDLGFGKSNAILPSNRQAQGCTSSPIASRTRNHSVARQPISGNITCDTGTLSYNKGRRSHRKMSDNGHQPINQFSGSETKESGSETSNRSKINLQSFSVNHSITRKARSSLRVGKGFPSSDGKHVRRSCNQSNEKEELEEGNLKFREENALNVSPGEGSKLSVSISITPASCTSSVAAASPICMGDEYRKQSCRKNLAREIDSLVSQGSEPSSPMKDSRRRRDMANVRVLFSHHLDDDIIKHQKKILAKLGASVAPSIREATHFVTDKFVRTRNMLESIAFGKPVVTHLWLESCGQASCCIDEKNYILRDAKKEKEFGFSLPASLAHACQRPLLQGLKVWITPNTKPGVDILSSLVKAVHGLPLERIGRSVLNDEKIPDDLLALSCEEDYATCLPFLEKGGAVFSSELLLNGIVSQKLEFERHRLFDDRVKKTRSTRWPKQDSNKYLPATKGI